MQVLKVKYHNGMEEFPLRIKSGNGGIDVYASENISVPKNKLTLISLGISIKVPKGWQCILLPRSSSYKNFNILQANSIGLIDESYQGNNDIWKLPVISDKDIEIKRGDKIAQFMIVPNYVENFFIEEVESLDAPDRGGFGTSGSCYKEVK